MLSIAELENKTRDELEALAKDCGISGYSNLKKSDLALHILKSQAEQQGNLLITGVLEIMSEGYGFLRQDTFLRSVNDVYV